MIRMMTEADFKAFWPYFKDIIQAQQSYAFAPDLSLQQAQQLWLEQAIHSFVFEQDGEVLGSYYIKANGQGPASHVCNCGYMVAPEARGQGLAKQLCLHSQQLAIELGFSAMQFNSVVSSNEAAIALWKKLGYKIIGTIPQAYRHPQLGLVDSYIMHKFLVSD